MRKLFIVFLIFIVGIGFLGAQTADDDYYSDENDTAEVGVPSPPNKYLILALSLFILIGFYFLLLSQYPNLLARGVNPLTAAASQCLNFSLISAAVILLALFAMSGFHFSNIGATLMNNSGLVIFIAVVWFLYFIISVSNKNKGASK
jgi:hypothetical protein